ncbi:hypothetical protein BDV96DRAFT_499788 [Lophiotrema nucula]|uniref:DUF676 domain-containing protein n=1 Tax=Lophiotrema nucula TaxID=690887 RepID=A0A6A5YVG9_9PLEO|nr:hypothetical protein BDV96DRAFT_499788 [Lophiotrema nucula]
MRKEKLASSKEREEAIARDIERKEFVAFALKLFDERQVEEQKNGNPAPKNTEKQRRSPPIEMEATLGALSIEQEINERNRIFEKLKAGGRSQAAATSTSNSEKRAKKETLYAVPIEQLNFQVMNSQQTNARVDIVAVHGLGAIPNITWKERTSGIDWLSHDEMLPNAAPEARILRFGYDSLWMGKTPIRTSLSTIAYKLLLSLSMIRVEDLHRPLIFVGHCFGGLVIQRALNIAKMRQSRYPGVFDSSVGIVFLGTPHRGTKSFTHESALLAAIAASSDLSQNLETGILDTMTSESGALLDVADDFITLCTDGGPMLSCFYEQRSSKLGKVVGRNDIDEFIVDHTSATFDGHPRYGLEVDHFSLNKFNGPHNPNYVQVRTEIARFYQAALKKLEKVSDVASMRSSINVTPSTIASTSTDNLRPAQNSARLSRRPASPDLRRPGSRSTRPSSMHGRTGSHSRSGSAAGEDEDELRKAAIKELQEEEAKKQRHILEEENQKRILEEKHAAEQQYLERLKKNMVKYGIENPDEILAAYPLPNDKDLTQQEIKDKDKWYKNVLKGELSAAGLEGGQIDEILNDTGDMMVIDDVETTFTRMAKKWISTRTLDRYKIPWQDDEADKSSTIIKRWVPDYERDFLWDHSQAVRESRGRKSHRDHDRTTKEFKRTQETLHPPAVHEKDWFARMMDTFRDTQKKDDRRTTDYNPAGNAYFEDRHDALARPTRRLGPSIEEINKPFGSGEHYSMPMYTPRRSNPIKSTGITTPPNFRRTSSQDSMHSAPDIQEVEKRRRYSRALSRSQERAPIARRSGEFSRRNSYDGRTRRSPSPVYAHSYQRGPKPRKTTDVLQERILKGDFYMD